MKLEGLHSGSEVEVDIKGRRFEALTTSEPEGGGVSIEPLGKGITYRRASARQIKRVIRRRRSGEAAQLGFGV